MQRNRATWLEFDRLFQPSRAMAQAFHWLPRDPNHALEVLPKIQAQTLVLTGRFDRNGGAQLNREVADLLPNSSFAIFERTQHRTSSQATASGYDLLERLIDGAALCMLHTEPVNPVNHGEQQREGSRNTQGGVVVTAVRDRAERTAEDESSDQHELQLQAPRIRRNTTQHVPKRNTNIREQSRDVRRAHRSAAVSRDHRVL